MDVKERASNHVRPALTLACMVASDEVEPLLAQLRVRQDINLSVIWVLDGKPGEQCLTLDGSGPSLPSARQLEALIECAADADVVVVSERPELLSRAMAFMLVELVLNAVVLLRLRDFLAAPEILDRKPQLDPGAVKAVIDLIEARSHGRRVKRLTDIAAATCGLVLAAPLMLAIGLVVRLDSPGPALLVQERLGQHRQPFRCFKFRTMVADAERGTGPVWASADDRRITRIGRFLRKSRLDELPQLFNVLRGDMSIVGARPIRKHFADQLAELLPIYDLRFVDKPGLTGWAQVKFKYSSSMEEQILKFHYDYYYIRNRSLWLDFYIMVLTAWTLVRMKGA